jgi:hypothetical protein
MVLLGQPGVGATTLPLIAEPAPGALITGEHVLEAPAGTPPADGNPQPFGDGGIAEPSMNTSMSTPP